MSAVQPPGVSLAEIVAILAAFEPLDVAVAVDDADDEGGFAFTVYVPPGAAGAASLRIAELHERLEYLLGVASVREFAARYGIDRAALAAFLPRRYDVELAAPVRRPAVSGVGTAARELDAIVEQLVDAQVSGVDSSSALDAVYSRLRVYFGDDENNPNSVPRSGR